MRTVRVHSTNNFKTGIKNMLTYDNDMLNEMCSKIDLLEYAQQTYEFKKISDDNFATNCPKHVDKTPSLVITPSKNLFYCFSCKRGGSLIHWKVEFENKTFSESVNEIAVLSGTSLRQLRQCTSLKIYKDIKNATESKSKNETVTRTLLKEDILNSYLNEQPDEWIEEGIDKTVMQEYGVRVDQSKNRIVYPIYDNSDNLISIKGRTRFADYKQLGITKYQFYTKIGELDFFVGWRQAKRYIEQTGTVYIFEGIKSVMKVRPWGYKNAVSSETSRLAEGQIQWLIKNRVRNVVICFDSDVELKQILENVRMLKRFVNVYIMIDRQQLLGGKDAKCSPCDKGKDIFMTLDEGKIRV